MSEELDTAQRCRLHAEELRTIAADRLSLENRDTLMRLAEDYEHMARTLEAIDKTNPSMRRRSSVAGG
jgi:hypothetical protein